jgi:hypothetical protein
MMAARDEARARIAARLGLIGGAGYAAPGAPVPANVRADTLAEERALGGREQTGRASWWGVGRPLPNERRIVGGRIVVRQQSGNGGGGRAVPAISRPRLAARQRALEASAWHPTPRPGAGRAPTTAG